jgi:hypothetical protein
MKKMSKLRLAKEWLSLAILMLACAGIALAQDSGLTTTIRFGSALPSGAKEWTFFTLTDGTGLYQCQNSPTCTNAGQWVVIGGSGGTCSGTCANLALSNLTTTAIAVPLQSAAGDALNLQTPNDDGSHAAQSVNITAGNGGSVGAGGNVVILSGQPAVGTNPGGNVTLMSGGAPSSGGTITGNVVIGSGAARFGTFSGNVSITTGNAVYGSGTLTIQTGYSAGEDGAGAIHIIAGEATGNASGDNGSPITIVAGDSGTTGCSTCSGGSVSITAGQSILGPPGNIVLTTSIGTSSFVSGAIELLAGTTNYPGSVVINLGTGAGAAPGLLHMTSGVWNYDTDNTMDFDIATQRPRNAYFGGNVVAGGNLTGSGSATLTGSITGNSVATNGSGPWQVQGSYGTLSVSSAGKTRFGFGALGPEFSFNGGTLTYFATLDGSGNVAQNADSATKLAVAGTPCAGAFATGVDAYGNALCNTASYIQLPQIAAPSGVSGYGLAWFDLTTGTLEANINNTGAVQFVHPNLFNTTADILEEYDGVTAQTYNLYGTYTSSTNFERLHIGYSGSAAPLSDADYLIGPEYGSAGGSLRNLCIWMGIQGSQSCRFQFTTGNVFRPTSNGTYDLADATHQFRNLYLGTAIYANGGFGTAGYCLLSGGSSSAADYWATCPGGGGGIGYPSGTGIAAVVSGASWGTTYSVSGTGTTVPLTASPTFTGTLNAAAGAFSGNVTIGGTLTLSGAGAAETIGAGGTLTAPGASQSAMGINASMHWQIALNGSSSFNDIVITQTCASHKWLAQVDQVATVGNCTQPAFTDISGSVAASQIPSPTSSALGGIESITSASHQWVAYIDTSGVPHQSQPASTDLSDTVPTTATLVNGNYASATGAKALADSTVTAGPYACEWLTYPTLGSGIPTTGGTANKATVWGINLAEPCTSTKITYDVITGDTSGGTYDLGLYTYAGVLAAHIGNTAASTAFTATGQHTVNWTGTATLQAGKYYLAITCSATSLCATFGGASSNGVTFVSNTAVSVSSGGTLSTPITPPADSTSYGSAIPVMIIQ